MNSDGQKQDEYPRSGYEPSPAYNPTYGSPYSSNPQYGTQYGQTPQTVHIVGVVSTQRPGQCLHTNQMTSYHICALACIIILCIEFFPTGLFALLCLGTITKHKCCDCGYEFPTNNLIAVYITFGILQSIFIGLIVLVLLSSI